MCLNTAVPKVDIAVRAQQWLSRCLVRAWLDNTVVLGGLELASLALRAAADLWWGTREHARGGRICPGSASVMFWGAESVLPSFVCVWN
jgi:hypothetical protein